MNIHRFAIVLGMAWAAACLGGCQSQSPWEKENPVRPLPAAPLGVQAEYAQQKFKVTPEKVRLGRWLFFDKRLSAGAGIACANCHQPDAGLSERTPVSTGIRDQKGNRKAPTLVNVAWPLFDNFFRDGRAGSLIEQAAGPITNPIEMGSTPERTVAALAEVKGYLKAFREAFGDEKITMERIGEAISAYECTRMSGGSAYDRFDAGEASAFNAKQQAGRALFYGKGACSQCHIGWNFTDTRFHNLGVGWQQDKGAFSDEGRVKISGKKEDTGAFKTPTLRDATKHPPYMHDGSIPTLRAVVELYNRGGNPNPYLSPKIKGLGLSEEEIDSLVAFLESLEGKGYEDTAPARFPE